MIKDDAMIHLLFLLAAHVILLSPAMQPKTDRSELNLLLEPIVRDLPTSKFDSSVALISPQRSGPR